MKFFISVILLTQCLYAEYPDIRTIPQNLFVPKISEQEPQAGKRVKVRLKQYKNTELYHTVYLPKNWQSGKTYPLILEYAGNGPYRNKYGDTSTGKVDGSLLGYGISEGKDFIWICLPYVNEQHSGNQTQWWGDLKETVAYCKKVVSEACKKYGADKNNIFLCGFSRGAIACNYIGLYDDEIAGLWKAFICYSHYDGVRKWQYKGSDKESAKIRLNRLKGRAQYIIHEQSVEATKKYIESTGVKGNFTFKSLPYRNHNPSWVLRKTKAAEEVRLWLNNQLEAK